MNRVIIVMRLCRHSLLGVHIRFFVAVPVFQPSRDNVGKRRNDGIKAGDEHFRVGRGKEDKSGWEKIEKQRERTNYNL